MTSAVPTQVSLPSALIHGSASNDPRVKELQEELNTVNKKILDNELDIPPEGQRSPSPEPVYDRNGIRLNTREVRGWAGSAVPRRRHWSNLLCEEPAQQARST